MAYGKYKPRHLIKSHTIYVFQNNQRSPHVQSKTFDQISYHYMFQNNQSRIMACMACTIQDT